MTDGTHLSQTNIFKWKSLPKEAKFTSEVPVHAHRKDWMNKIGILEWLDRVWHRRKGSIIDKLLMLERIRFHAHVMDAVKDKWIFA